MTPAPESPAPGAKPERLVSLDALRGFDMFWILGADSLVHELAKTWDIAPLRIASTQLEHKAWAGFGFYDLIFPLFLFIAGVSSVFSLTRLIERQGRPAALRRIGVRAAALVLFGIFYNGGLIHAWPDVRLMGVLQRIGIAYGIAGLLFCYLSSRSLAAVAAALLLGYWALLAWVPIRDFQLDKTVLADRFGSSRPDAARVREAFDATTRTVTGRYDPGLNLTNELDFEYLPGRKYDTYWDPEGYLSTLPAIVTCLLGIFAGLWLRRGDRSDAAKLKGLAIAGAASLAVGFTWGLWFPVVKKIWTSSFVLVAGGWSLLLLAAFFYIVDMRRWRGWSVPFVWIGMNPITLYLADSVLDFQHVARRLTGGSVGDFFDAHVAPNAGAAVGAAGSLALVIALAGFLHRKKIFLRV